MAGLERETSLSTRCLVRIGVTAEGSCDCLTFESPDVIGGSDTSGTKDVKVTLDESQGGSIAAEVSYDDSMLSAMLLLIDGEHESLE